MPRNYAFTPPEALLPLRDVCAPDGPGPYRPSKFLEAVKLGDAPEPAMREPRCTRWRWADIKLWLDVLAGRVRLPAPAAYYDAQGLELRGRGTWRDALCLFHVDPRPSLRVNVETGGFRCSSCGASGSTVVAFHRRRYLLGFVQAVHALEQLAAVDADRQLEPQA